MDPSDALPDGAVSIEVGEGTSRRDVLKRVGAAGGVAAGTGSAVAVGEGSTVAATEDGTTHTVEMSDGLVFEPDSLIVGTGDTVVFENVGTVGHSVTAYEDSVHEGADYWASGGFDSEDAAREAYSSTGALGETGNVTGGESWSHTFEVEAVHQYFCIPHEAAGMVGEIVVDASPPPDDTTAETPTDAETTDGEPVSSGVVRSARRYPAVAPPGWDASDTESGAGDTERTAVFLYESPQNSFFLPMTVGFHDALNTYGWTGQAAALGFAPVGVQPRQIENLIESRLGAGDVLVVTIRDDSVLNEAIQRALDNGIVVVNAYRTPHPEDWNHEFMRNEANGSGFRYRDRPTIVPRVGIDEARAGAAMAAEAYERLKRTNPDPDGGEYTALTTNGNDRDPSVTRRVDASAADRGTAQRYLENRSDPSVTLYGDTIFSDEIDPNASGAESQIESIIAGDENEIDAVLSAGYWSAVGAGNLIDKGVLPEDVIIGGFDLDQRMIDSIRNGFIDFAVGQDPYGQGYRSASLAWTYLERGIPMRDLEVGVSVFDESNIAFADERRNWSDLKRWQERNYDGLT